MTYDKQHPLLAHKVVEVVATVLANQRGGRNGAPPIKNVLEALPPKLKAEVVEDARLALEAVAELFPYTPKPKLLWKALHDELPPLDTEVLIAERREDEDGEDVFDFWVDELTLYPEIEKKYGNGYAFEDCPGMCYEWEAETGSDWRDDMYWRPLPPPPTPKPKN